MLTSLNWVDLVVVTTVILTAYVGFSRGTIIGLLLLLASVSVTVLTVNYAPVVEQWIQPWLHIDPAYSTSLIFWGIFLILFLVIRMLVRRLIEAIHGEPVNLVTQSLGALVGGLRGVWWSGLFLIVLSSSGFDYLRQSVEERSLIGPRVVNTARSVLTDVAHRFPGGTASSQTTVPAFRPASPTATGPQRSQ